MGVIVRSFPWICNASIKDKESSNVESKEALKVSKSKVYGGSVVYDGEALMKVDCIGDNTLMGKISYELQEVVPESPLKTKLRGLAKTISRIGSIFTFEIKGTSEDAQKFIDNLKVFSLLANVADVKSLAIHPATTTHSQLNEEELAEQGIKPNTIRLSIGTEHIDDIIFDLEEAFKAVANK